MPELKDNSKLKLYKEEIVPTQQIDNFLDKSIVNEVLNVYDEIENYLSELVGKRTRLFEMDFVPDFPPSYIGYLTKEEDDKGWDSHDLEPGDTIYNVLCEKMKDKFEPLITTPDIIMENLKKLGHNNLRYRQMSLHNLDSFLPTHCDGNNIKNRNKGRPIPTNPEDWLEDKHSRNPNDHFCCFQGMITLKTDNDYGTAVFDQWFPWSVYYMPNHTEETLKQALKSKKSRITFFKDEDINRFNEHIRNYTGKNFSQEDFEKLKSELISNTTLDIEAFFGLSLEKVAKFGEPGRLNLWDNKKFHMTMPWNVQFQTTRKMIQFETQYK